MSMFTVHYVDECGDEGSMEVHDCSTHSDVRDYMEEQYPDLRVDAIYSQEEINTREADRYNRIAEEIDNGWY